MANSIIRNTINVGTARFTERPYFAWGRDVINEELDLAPARGAFYIHIQQSVLFPEKR